MAERRGNYPPTDTGNSTESNLYPSEETFQSAKLNDLVFAFYPNPVPLENPTIQLTHAMDVHAITLLDLSGRIAYSESVNKEIKSFSFPALEAGTYIIKVQTTLNKEYHEKIILY